MSVHTVRCSEVWGGVRSIDLDVSTSGLVASLYCSAADGGKGGDVYYFSVCDSDLLTRIAVADVVGHGAAVSRVSTWLYDALVEKMNSLEGNGVLRRLNHLASERGLDALTTAAVVGVYRADTHLYFSYAGHPPLLIRRHSERAWRPADLPQREGPANLPLGVAADTHYDQEAMPIAAGDRLCLCTDGVLEARNGSGEPFGSQRLLALLERSDGDRPQVQKQALLTALYQHTGGALDHDDVTIMMLEVR